MGPEGIGSSDDRFEDLIEVLFTMAALSHTHRLHGGYLQYDDMWESRLSQRGGATKNKRKYAHHGKGKQSKKIKGRPHGGGDTSVEKSARYKSNLSGTHC